jgi:type I restriction-modification system DNA methylase subunit
LDNELHIQKNRLSVYNGCIIFFKQDDMSQLISTATQKNWERLGIITTGVRLKSRANKTSSDRIIFPIEYFHDKKNISLVQNVVSYAIENNLPIENVLYSVALRCFEHNGFIVDGIALQQNVCKYIEEYQHLSCIDFFADTILPFDESDLLGLLYQCLKSEGMRNRDGIYYTSSPVANILLRDVDVSNNQYFLDPCCGSGNLLLTISEANPKNLFGIDSDPIAIMIAKCNMIMKYPGNDFSPQIFHRDFLETNLLFAANDENPIEEFRFDYIITNPPWGAVSNFGDIDFSGMTPKESFSAFLIKSMDYLSPHGKLRFLLPESFLHIKTHSDIRSFILKNYHIEEIRNYPHSFSGVSTKFIDVTITKNRNKNITSFHYPDKNIFVDSAVFMKNKHSVFSIITGEDRRIIDYINNQGIYNLSESIFGLGIVTGNNKSKLFETSDKNLESIYSGKEVSPYHLEKAKYFIHYCREEFQQTAKESIYRAPIKLAYKFISRKLVFAYDNSQSLFLNSANLLIPNIKGMNIKTVLAFLNSELYQFLYQKQFADIKVLKSSLMELPFPTIDEITNQKITEIVDMILSGQNDMISVADDIIYEIFHVNDNDRKYIKDSQ